MLGTSELVVIGLIIVVLFGASRLPQVGRGLGKAISNFKHGLKEGEGGEQDELLPEESSSPR